MKSDKFWAWLVFGLGAAYFIVPLAATFEFSLRMRRGEYSFDAYASVFADPYFASSFTYSVVVGLFTIVVGIFVVVPAVYFVRLRMPWLRPFMEFITLLPLVIPALVPPLIVVWALFALSAARLRTSTIRVVTSVLLAAIVAVCVSIWPLSQMRKNVDDQETARLQKYDADLARVAVNAPLWDWVPFLDTRDGTKRERVLDSIRRLDQRQVQAEAMLDRGDFPLGFLGFFDLDPTPALCAKARALLGKRAQSLVSSSDKPQPYAGISEQVSGAVAAMGWLVGYGCSCDAESKAWEVMAQAYADPSYDVYRLAELRDPKQLG
jgi:hypothetical protein